MIPISIGCGIILLSYIVIAKHQHYHRYLFGVGVSLCLIGIGTVSTGLRQEASLFTFPDISQVYDAVITDIPQEKPYTINLKVELSDTRKQVVCYLPKNKLSKGLRAGDHISFFGKISKFESSRDSDGFDYAAFMRNKGYAGVIFVKNGEWQQNESSSSGIKIWSSRCRQAVLKIYRFIVRRSGSIFQNYRYGASFGYQRDAYDSVLFSNLFYYRFGIISKSISKCEVCVGYRVVVDIFIRYRLSGICCKSWYCTYFFMCRQNKRSSVVFVQYLFCLCFYNAGLESSLVIRYRFSVEFFGGTGNACFSSFAA